MRLRETTSSRVNAKARQVAPGKKNRTLATPAGPSSGKTARAPRGLLTSPMAHTAELSDDGDCSGSSPCSGCDYHKLKDAIADCEHQNDQALRPVPTMKTCKTCKWWDAKGTFSRKVNGYGACYCDKFIFGYGIPQTATPDQMLVENDEGWAFQTGPDFGCIHHTTP